MDGRFSCLSESSNEPPHLTRDAILPWIDCQVQSKNGTATGSKHFVKLLRGALSIKASRAAPADSETRIESCRY